MKIWFIDKIMTKNNLHNIAINITHGDVDGMVCAAQIIRREKSNCEVQFSNAKYIGSKSQSILHRDPIPARLYITDIPANEEAAGVVEQLSKKGVHVYWIDHHPWMGKELKGRISKACKKLVYNEDFYTPAGALLGRWLAGEDPYFERVGNICYAYEKGTPWERNWFLLLSNYVGKADIDVLKHLALDCEFTKEDRQRIENQILLEKKVEEILNNEPDCEKTQKGKCLAVYDTCNSPGIYLGHKVFDHHKVDYCLIRFKKRKWQIASSPQSGLTLEAIFGIHNLDDMTITAFGRPKQLLAIEIENAEVPPSVHEKIIDWIKRLL